MKVKKIISAIAVFTLCLCNTALANNIAKTPQSTSSDCSAWARESIEKAIALELVPENLQSNYTQNITRAEFCRLAVQTYAAKTGYEVDTTLVSPFDDADDYYITTAYNLHIVSGMGDNKFAPDKEITRQEAAVMLFNLADLLNVENSFDGEGKFSDEEYISLWAHSPVYAITAIKSGDTKVMAGTGNGKFSPWMNYTREQAISTMYRLYNCKQKSVHAKTENTDYTAVDDEVESDIYDGQQGQFDEKMKKRYGNLIFYTLRSETKGVYYTVLYEYDLDTGERDIVDYQFVGTIGFSVEDDYLQYTLSPLFGDSVKYSIKYDLTEKTRIDYSNNSKSKILCNGKYKFYMKTDIIDKPNGKDPYSFYTYMVRSDMNGENEEKIHDGSFDGKLILYGDYIYSVDYTEKTVDNQTEYTENIIRMDFDGNIENVTDFSKTGTNIDENLRKIDDIVKIEDGKIYFTAFSYDGFEINTNYLYVVNIDGTDGKALKSN